MSTTAEEERVGEVPAEDGEAPEEQEPETSPDTDDEDAEGEEGLEPEPEPQGRRGKSPEEKFHSAFSAFVRKAAECFELTPADVTVAPHPGVVGIMLPGFAEPKMHSDFTTCLTCNGIGKVLTGAVTGDPAKDFNTCPDTRCKGNGYWRKQGTVAAPPTTGPLAPAESSATGDEWGEAPAWLGDPNITPGQ